MSDARVDQAALATLRAENGLLKAQIAWLTGDDDDAAVTRLRLAFGIKPRNAQMLLIIYRRRQVTHGAVYDALYGAVPGCDQPNFSIVKVLMCQLRRALGDKITIQTIWGVGFRMEESSRAVIRAVLEGKESDDETIS